MSLPIFWTDEAKDFFREISPSGRHPEFISGLSYWKDAEINSA